MQILKFFQSVRTPALDAFFSTVTHLGEEQAFMVLGLVFLWCVNKRWGYRICFLCMLGNVSNQLLKGIFCVPRPWLLDPSLTIVESAREAATGYSFPSGHTQAAAVLFGSIAALVKRRGLTVGCGAAILLVALSRLYLGVHTPLDVGAALALGLLIVAVFSPLLDRLEEERRAMWRLWWGLTGLSVLTLAFLLLGPANSNKVEQFEADGVKTAWTMLGALLGILATRFVDQRFPFPVEGVWWVQTLKALLGLCLVLAVKEGLKQPLLALCGGNPISNGIRYFLVVAAGGILWPLTFPFWARIGKGKQT